MVLPLAAFPGHPAFASNGRKRASDGGGAIPDPGPGSRPTGLPTLTTPGAQFLAWWDLTGTVPLNSSNDLTSAPNAAPGALTGALAPVGLGPRRVAGAAGSISSAQFSVTNRLRLLESQEIARSNSTVFTALVLFTRNGLPRLDAIDDDPARQSGTLLQFSKLNMHTRNSDGAFILDPSSPQNTQVIHAITDKGSPSAPWSGWIMQRWQPSQAPIGGVNVGGQPVQTTRSWTSRAPDTPVTFGVSTSSEIGTATIVVGNGASDATFGNPCKELLHEVVVVRGVLNETDINTLKIWANARLNGVVTVPTDPGPVDPDPVDPSDAESDPPATWGIAMQDDFDVVYPVNRGLNPDIWKHTNFGNSGAHGGAAVWDGGSGFSVADSKWRIAVRKVGGTWYVPGALQGASTDPNHPYYHPGYGEYHVRFRARWSHAIAPGIGWYALMWPATDIWSTEFDIMEMPGRIKNRAESTGHWGMFDEQGNWNPAGHRATPARFEVDLTAWHTWDQRRVFRMLNGRQVATLYTWIDGVQVTPALADWPEDWTDNPDWCEPMVFGPAGYVAPETVAGWYTTPNGETPAEAFAEIDFVRIWTPEAGGGGVVVPPSITLEYPSGDLVAGGGFTVNARTTGISSLQYAVFSSSGVAYSDWIRVSVGAGNLTTIVGSGPLQTNDYIEIRKDGDSAVKQRTPGAAAAPSTGAGTPGDVMITLQGQSNAHFLWERNASRLRLQDGLAALTGLQPSQLKWATGIRINNGEPATIQGGTGTFDFPFHSWYHWFNPDAVGAVRSNPATWGQNDLMDDAILMMTTKRQEISPNRPWLFVRMHSENDQRQIDTLEEQGIYGAANREFIRRFRNAAQRDAALMPVFYHYVAYNGSKVGKGAITAAWDADVKNVAFNARWASGDEFNVSSFDGGSHWDEASSTFHAGMLAISLAKYLHTSGYTQNDLSWLPTLGPHISAAKPVSGQPDAADLTITHDKGNDIIIPGGFDPARIECFNGSESRFGTSVTKLNATTLRVVFDGSIAGPAGVVTLRYSDDAESHGLGTAITDNWGALGKPSYAPGWMTGLNMPLQRLRSPLSVTDQVIVAPTQRLPVFSNNIADAPLNVDITVTVTGLLANEEFTWASVKGSAPYTWKLQGSAKANGAGVASFTSKLLATNDFFKLVFADGTWKDSVSVTTVNPSVPGEPSGDAAFTYGIHSSLRHGFNIERWRPVYMNWRGNPLATSQAYWAYLRNTVGLTHVRFFYPWGNDNLLGNNIVLGNGRPAVSGQNSINQFLQPIIQASRAGLFTFVDYCDVCSWDRINGAWADVTAHLADFSTAIGNVPELGPDKCAVGAFNELMEFDSTNVTYNQIRMDTHDVIRSRLPQHIIVHGADRWNRFTSLMDNQWQPPPDRLSMGSAHPYTGDNTNVATYADMNDAVLDFETRHGIPAVAGEWGGNNQKTAVWGDLIRAVAQGAPRLKAMWWAVTDGSDFQMNVSGSDPTLMPLVEEALIESREAMAT